MVGDDDTQFYLMMKDTSDQNLVRFLLDEGKSLGTDSILGQYINSSEGIDYGQILKLKKFTTFDIHDPRYLPLFNTHHLHLSKVRSVDVFCSSQRETHKSSKPVGPSIKESTPEEPTKKSDQKPKSENVVPDDQLLKLVSIGYTIAKTTQRFGSILLAVHNPKDDTYYALGKLQAGLGRDLTDSLINELEVIPEQPSNYSYVKDRREVAQIYWTKPTHQWTV